MFESKRFWMFLAMVLFVLNIGLLSVFYFPKAEKPPMPERVVDSEDPFYPLVKRLNLSDEQKRNLANQFDSQDRSDLTHQLMKNRHQLMQLSQSEEFNSPKKDSLIQEIASLQSQIDRLTSDRLHALYSVSNPKQRDVMRKLGKRMLNRIEHSRQSRPKRDVERNRKPNQKSDKKAGYDD